MYAVDDFILVLMPARQPAMETVGKTGLREWEGKV